MSEPASSHLGAGTAARVLLDAVRRGERVVEAVVVEGDGVEVGTRLLIGAERVDGGTGSVALDRAIVAASHDVDAAGTREVEADGATIRVYFEVHAPAAPLVIVGGGHIARPLAAFGTALGFAVTVLDDRPEFATAARFGEGVVVRRVVADDPFRGLPIDGRAHVVLVTRGHRYDYHALIDLLRREVRPRYIGMVGSRRRVRATYEQLVAEGVPADRLAEVSAPIGLDVGAETPEEIATAIAAELVLARRGGTGRPLREVERVAQRWFDAQPVVRSSSLDQPMNRTDAVNRLLEIREPGDIPGEYRDTPIGKLLEYHNLEREFGEYSHAELLIGMCMDNRKHLRIPDNFAYILRAGGANLRPSEFKVSYAVAVGGVQAIALIGHTQCGMVNLMARKQAFVDGLVERAGWDRNAAEEHFLHFSPLFEIGSELDFVLSETNRLRLRYPRVLVAPMLYRVEDNRLYLIEESRDS